VAPQEPLPASSVIEREPGSTMDKQNGTELWSASWLSTQFSLRLLPGYNISRNCTEEGWSQLEPGPYHIACGLNDRASSMDEVRGSCASVNPGVHPLQVHIAQDPSLAPLTRYTQDFS
jgi:hypothetical protein